MPILVLVTALVLALVAPAAAQVGCAQLDNQVFCGDFVINGFTTQNFQNQAPNTPTQTCVGFEAGANHQGLVHLFNPSPRSVPVTIDWLNLAGVIVFQDRFSLDAGRAMTVGRGDADHAVPTVVRVTAKSVLVDASMVYDFDPAGPNLHRRQVACFPRK
jgi:hypothetical protein